MTAARLDRARPALSRLVRRDWVWRGRQSLSGLYLPRQSDLARCLQSSVEIIESIAAIREWRRDYGHADKAFEVMATPSDAWEVDGYRRLEAAGVTHIMTMPWALYHGESDKLEHKIDGIKRFADDVISKFS